MISYPKKNRALLMGYTLEAMVNFALEIPVSELGIISTHLPKQTGFRSKQKELSQQFKFFFGKMGKWTEKDWLLMMEIWMLWTKTKLPVVEISDSDPRSAIMNLIEEIVKSDHGQRKFIRKLILKENNTVTRELLQRWYDFGPTYKYEAVEELILVAPTQEQLKIKDRVERLEQDLISLDSESVTISQKLESGLPETRFGLDIKSKLMNLQAAIDQYQVEISDYKKGLSELSKKYDKANKQLTDRKADIKQFQSDVKSIQELATSQKISIAKLRDECREQLALYQNESNSKFEGLNKEFERLKESFGAFSEETKSILDTFSQVAISQTQQPDMRSSSQPMLRSTLLNAEQYLDYQQIQSVDDALDNMVNNINSLGVRKPYAKQLVAEIFAALAAGQIVSFEGALSILLAERCGQSLAGDQVYVIRVPVGLLDGESLETELTNWIEKVTNSDSPVALILEGINRSAIETYASFLQQFIAKRLLEVAFPKSKALLLFATIAEGPSAIPIGKEILELGPVFNTDALGWRSRPASLALRGRFSSDNWMAVINDSKGESKWEDDLVPKEVLFLGGALWRRTLITALSYYGAFHADGQVEENVTLQPIVFGWLIPMLVRISPEKTRAVLDSVTVDDRLKNLLYIKAPDLVSEDE